MSDRTFLMDTIILTLSGLGVGMGIAKFYQMRQALNIANGLSSGSYSGNGNDNGNGNGSTNTVVQKAPLAQSAYSSSSPNACALSPVSCSLTQNMISGGPALQSCCGRVSATPVGVSSGVVDDGLGLDYEGGGYDPETDGLTLDYGSFDSY